MKKLDAAIANACQAYADLADHADKTMRFWRCLITGGLRPEEEGYMQRMVMAEGKTRRRLVKRLRLLNIEVDRALDEVIVQHDDQFLLVLRDRHYKLMVASLKKGADIIV